MLLRIVDRSEPFYCFENFNGGENNNMPSDPSRSPSVERIPLDNADVGLAGVSLSESIAGSEGDNSNVKVFFFSRLSVNEGAEL